MMNQCDTNRSVQAEPTVGFLLSPDLIEDWLDSLQVSFEAFCNEMTGSWVFGYSEALRRNGVRTVLFCVSARVAAPLRFVHAPTGAAIHFLPAPQLYRYIRSHFLKDFPGEIAKASVYVRGIRRFL